MDEQELKELMRLLENAGVRANLCDTPIPVSTNSARCGEPSEIGDERIDDYILIPKAVVGTTAENGEDGSYYLAVLIAYQPTAKS